MLKEWRLEQANIQKMPAYCIFSDKELWSIAEGDVCKKEDLLLVNGISDEELDDKYKEMLPLRKVYIPVLNDGSD